MADALIECVLSMTLIECVLSMEAFAWQTTVLKSAMYSVFL